MIKKTADMSLLEQIYYHAGDIIASDRLKQEDIYRQHGSVTCYEHSVAVTLMSVRFVQRLHLKLDMESMIKGALLHDYFLYDWRSTENDINRRHHGFHHAQHALKNACRDFTLSPVTCDVIRKHMFPLNIRPPRYKESVVVCIADKVVATREVCRFLKGKLKTGAIRPVSRSQKQQIADI